MHYYEIYQLLKNLVNYTTDKITIDKHTDLFNLDFLSENYRILPGEENYICNQHPGKIFQGDQSICNPAIIDEILDTQDSKVIENCIFKYHVFKPSYDEKSKHVILLFHGFNEKYWDKYLPWAKVLSEKTGAAIILFPVSFHMNRAPHIWSDKRLMFQISELRKKNFPDVINSTLSNVAISARIQCKPQRFFWSGLQTYYDVIQLVNQIKEDRHPIITPDATVDIFAYSIGSLLGEILMMTNTQNIFDKSKLFMFCGGPVFNRMTPVSRFIIDSEANVALYSYAVEHLESHIKNDARFGHYFGKDHKEGMVLLSMLTYKLMKPFREELLASISQRIMSLALEKDEVVSPYEVINTLNGSSRNIPIITQTMDFPYDYRHEDPFPLNVNIKEEVEISFEKVFNMAADFFG